MMKTSKSAQQTSEQCGVWFDTVDLKVKAKKKMVLPISKQLNPLARHGGYRLGVALNFTQTKIQMPNTKQSSITAFLAPAHCVVNQAHAEPKVEPAFTSSSTSTGRSTTSTNQMSSGTKHKQEIVPELSEEHRVDVGCEWSRKKMGETGATAWPEEVITLPVDMYHASEQEKEDKGTEEPKRKRDIYKHSSQMEKGSPGEPCSENLWSTGSSPQYRQHLAEPDQMDCVTHDSEDRDVRTRTQETPRARHECTGSVMCESLLSEVGFGLGAEGRTSTQRTPASTPWMSQDGGSRENHPLSSSAAFPRTRAPLSPLGNAPLSSQNRWMEAKPQKGVLHGPLSDTEMLFTQDSEGFRVIAHRGPSVQSRSCPKSHTNVAAGSKDRGLATCVALDQENEIFFTQDSEGNIVIKHCDFV
ncbi:uncharacterized protein LOC124488103 isoform X2 [Hypomesus transpacificus]|uniref:uncharacterized protein LOC124488103 isoform X2 n=1 Tax=Hypomesus transpacificus TaxID=137520 RepID=UPI001F083531|nr:uncharacterized protein LOC124488103 isoform X2 [Hypomesus transpacificus]